MRSSGTSTRLTPLKLKSNSTRYVDGSAETRWTIVPSASCTFWLKATPLIVRPLLRFTFTRWFGSNTPEPPQITWSPRGRRHIGAGADNSASSGDPFFPAQRNSQRMVDVAGGLCNGGDRTDRAKERVE